MTSWSTVQSRRLRPSLSTPCVPLKPYSARLIYICLCRERFALTRWRDFFFSSGRFYGQNFHVKDGIDALASYAVTELGTCECWRYGCENQTPEQQCRGTYQDLTLVPCSIGSILVNATSFIDYDRCPNMFANDHGFWVRERPLTPANFYRLPVGWLRHGGRVHLWFPSQQTAIPSWDGQARTGSVSWAHVEVTISWITEAGTMLWLGRAGVGQDSN